MSQTLSAASKMIVIILQLLSLKEEWLFLYFLNHTQGVAKRMLMLADKNKTRMKIKIDILSLTPQCILKMLHNSLPQSCDCKRPFLKQQQWNKTHMSHKNKQGQRRSICTVKCTGVVVGLYTLFLFCQSSSKSAEKPAKINSSLLTTLVKAHSPLLIQRPLLLFFFFGITPLCLSVHLGE